MANTSAMQTCEDCLMPFKSLWQNKDQISFIDFKVLLYKTHRFAHADEGYSRYILNHFKNQLSAEEYSKFYDFILAIRNGAKCIKSD